jgi:hypothetical protein
MYEAKSQAELQEMEITKAQAQDIDGNIEPRIKQSSTSGYILKRPNNHEPSYKKCKGRYHKPQEIEWKTTRWNGRQRKGMENNEKGWKTMRWNGRQDRCSVHSASISNRNGMEDTETEWKTTRWNGRQRNDGRRDRCSVHGASISNSF